MRWYEEVTVALVMLLWLGGPLFCFYTSVILLIWGTWTQVGYFCAAYLILGFHPLPNLEVTFQRLDCYSLLVALLEVNCLKYIA